MKIITQKKKNILYIRDSGGIFGAEQVILTSVKGLNKELFNVTLLCMEGGNGNSVAFAERASQFFIHVETLPVRGKIDLAALIEMRRILKERKIDIIHSHDYKSNLYALFASIGLPVRRVLTAHGSTRDTMLKRFYLFVDQSIVYRFFDRIIAVSEDLYQKIVRKGINKDRLAIIQNGLDPTLRRNNHTMQVPLDIPRNTRVYAVIGRLFPDKGHKYFLEAFTEVHRRYPDTFGLIVGEGPSHDEIKQQVTDCRLDRSVSMCGVRYDMDNVYEHVDYLVIPSLTEGLPYVLLEAMALGIPVVATTVGDIPKLIDDGRTGYLVAPGEVDQLAEKMSLFMEDPVVAEQMAKRAKEIVDNEYSSQRMVQQIEQLYLKI